MAAVIDYNMSPVSWSKPLIKKEGALGPPLGTSFQADTNLE